MRTYLPQDFGAHARLRPSPSSATPPIDLRKALGRLESPEPSSEDVKKKMDQQANERTRLARENEELRSSFKKFFDRYDGREKELLDEQKTRESEVAVVCVCALESDLIVFLHSVRGVLHGVEFGGGGAWEVTAGPELHSGILGQRRRTSSAVRFVPGLRTWRLSGEVASWVCVGGQLKGIYSISITGSAAKIGAASTDCRPNPSRECPFRAPQREPPPKHSQVALAEP